MNGYERAIRTLSFESIDSVATWGGWIVSASFFEYITGKPFWENPREVAIEAYRKLEVDMITQNFYFPNSQEEWRQHTDQTIIGGEKYKTPEDIVAYVESLPDAEGLEKEFDFDHHVDSIRSAYLEFQEELGSDILHLPKFQLARFTWYTEFGYENYLVAIALYPDIMRRLFEYSAEETRLTNMARVELIKEKTIPPFFFNGHDICGSRGPLVSPETLRSVYFPSLRRSLDPLVEVGAEIIWHSDGYIIPVVDDLISCGISGFQGFQEETGFTIGDIANHQVRGGRKPLLLAGLSITGVLPSGTTEDVKKEVERTIDSVGLGGGLAIGTANTAGPDCPDENLETLYRHTHEYGVY